MPTISLAVMVRDDAERLKRCIESVKDAVDDIVVLDTGSQDNTVDVAKASGAKVYEAPWDGSFSNGLNRLLEHVNTDWTLRLDSDEWFEKDPAPCLQAAMESPDRYGYRLVRRDILPDSRYREISIFRLWRTHSALRYAGIVHENITNESIDTAFPGLQVGASRLWFWHDGYAEPSNSKLERNIRLLEEELALRPDQPYYRAMRAVMYRDLGDPRALEDLTQVACLAMEEDKPSTRMYGSVFAALLQMAPDDQITTPLIDNVIKRGWKWFSEYPGVLWSIGLIETRRDNLAGALKAYLRLRSLVEQGSYETSLPFDPSILGPYLWNALGFTASRMGRMDIAAECAKRLQAGR